MADKQAYDWDANIKKAIEHGLLVRVICPDGVPLYYLTKAGYQQYVYEQTHTEQHDKNNL